MKKEYIKPQSSVYRVQITSIIETSDVRGGGPTDSFSAKGNNDDYWD